MDNLQALYKEKSETTNVASIEEEADGKVDRADSETSGARLFLAKGATKTRMEILTPRTRAGNWRAHVRRMVTWSTQTINSSEFEFLTFRAIR